jgi:hypothetical protein
VTAGPSPSRIVLFPTLWIAVLAFQQIPDMERSLVHWPEPGPVSDR